MDSGGCFLFLVFVPLVFVDGWSSQEDPRLNLDRRAPVQQAKRLLPREVVQEPRRRYLATTGLPREGIRERRKPIIDHNADEEYVDNEDLASVAIGPPPPLRLKPNRNFRFRHRMSQPMPVTPQNSSSIGAAANLVKDVLTNLGQEFMLRQLNEDFVFGLYVGSCMKHLSKELRLKMQHEILGIIVKFQRQSKEEASSVSASTSTTKTTVKSDKRHNDTEAEVWPDFSNLEKIVG